MRPFSNSCGSGGDDGACLEAAQSAKWKKTWAGGSPHGDGGASGQEGKRVPPISGRRRVFSAPARGAPELATGATRVMMLRDHVDAERVRQRFKAVGLEKQRNSPSSMPAAAST